jgi:hypothetical protein
LSKLRSFLKGWGANLKKEARAEKDSLINQTKVLDELADGVGLSEDEWGWRYHLEDMLVLLYQREEEYWRQRSRVKWTMQGNANTAYFHAVANGRRRKCAILSLQTPTGPISEKGAIQALFFRNGVSRPLHPKDAHSLFISIKAIARALQDYTLISLKPPTLRQIAIPTRNDGDGHG